MATLAQIQAEKLKQPVFVRALAVDKRLTDAIDEATFNRARLICLRKQLRWEIENVTAPFMELWLATFMQAIDHHIRVAFYEPETLPAEGYVAPIGREHYGLGEAA